MKIGILTYHWVANMGANLQALSTYCYLRNKGHEPIILNWIPSDVELYYLKNVSDRQIKAHRNFAIKNYDNISSLCRNSQEVADQIVAHDIHFVCIGSDAVFSTKPILSRWHLGRKGLKYIQPYSDAILENPFWGDFVKYLPTGYSTKIVAISASAQNSPYRKILFPSEKNHYYYSLKRFSKITVRDIWTQNMCRLVSGNKILPEITPDPVFGFNYNVNPPKIDYVKNSLGISGDYVLLSVSSSIKDDNWIVELEQLFIQRGITVVGLPKTNAAFKKVLKFNLDFPIDPLEWYDAIKFSKGYIGELMHPVLVSLHNGVPVFAFDTYGFRKNFKFDKTSSKTYQILKSFNLLGNYYNPLYNELPKPKTILNSILSTDSTKIRQQAKEYWLKYDSMMKYLLS